MEAMIRAGYLFIVCLVLLHIALTWIAAIRTGRRQRTTNLPGATAPASYPSVSVLIPAWREVSVIGDCLEALRRTYYPDWEAIIIAGGSDGTYEAVETAVQAHGSMKLVKQEPRGKNAALNQGLSIATGSVIVILDADTVVDPDWLPRLIDPIRAGAAAVCGNYFPLRETWVSIEEQMEKISNYVIHQVTILQGSGTIAIRRDILDAVGGFPEAVTVGVDWDLDARINTKQVAKAFAATAKVRTQRPATLREYWKNEIRWRRAHLRSLWVRRNWFLQTPRIALNSVSFYVVALVPPVTVLLMMASLMSGRSEFATLFLSLLALFVVWLVGRRAALAAEVASYTANGGWLKSAWTPGILLLVSMAASWIALATVSRPSVHFKGPRH